VDNSIAGIYMLILMESTLEEAVAFYQKIGFKQLFHLKDRWAELAAGNVRIGLCPTSQPPMDMRTGIVLEVSDLKTFYQTMKEQITFLQEPTEAVHGIMVSIKDPGGNIIDLYQPTPEKVAELVKEKVKEDKDDCCSDKDGQSAACC